MSIYTVLMIGAVISDIEAPIYIHLQIVLRVDGLNRFQAIDLPVFLRCLLVSIRL